MEGLIIGTNLGGLGTLIASMASLISYRQIAREEPEGKGKYFALFTVSNLVFWPPCWGCGPFWGKIQNKSRCPVCGRAAAFCYSRASYNWDTVQNGVAVFLIPADDGGQASAVVAVVAESCISTMQRSRPSLPRVTLRQISSAESFFPGGVLG